MRSGGPARAGATGVAAAAAVWLLAAGAAPANAAPANAAPANADRASTSPAPAVAAERARLVGQRVIVAPDGQSLRVLDVAGEGAPVVGVVDRRGAHLWLQPSGAGVARQLAGPLAVPRIAGPGYTVWVLGRVAPDGSLWVRRIGILARPGRTTASAPAAQGPTSTTK